MTRVNVYIDGFNLYFGLREANWKKYYWLDLVALCGSLLKPEQTLNHVYYFTARLRPLNNSPGRSVGATEDMRRQSIYLDALSTLPRLTIQEGHFLLKKRRCFRCDAVWNDPEEKMTDVNIASRMLADAWGNQFDAALLISGDSDLTTPVKMIRDKFPDKRIVVALPPKRNSRELTVSASAFFTIGESKLKHSQLPETVTLPNGHVLRRPEYWR